MIYWLFQSSDGLSNLISDQIDIQTHDLLTFNQFVVFNQAASKDFSVKMSRFIV